MKVNKECKGRGHSTGIGKIALAFITTVLLVLKYYITKIAYNYSQLPHDRSLVHKMNIKII